MFLDVWKYFSYFELDEYDDIVTVVRSVGVEVRCTTEETTYSIYPPPLPPVSVTPWGFFLGQPLMN